MAPSRVILMSCGSYNPPTNMHLRMFEIARDHLHRMGTHVVVGGVISPVHDAYSKKELASSSHRCAMLRLALQSNDWIRLSTWETRQNGWTKTRMSLQHHQNLLNSILFDANDAKEHIQIEDMEWIPENLRNCTDNTPIQIKLLCGADLLESFGIYGLWAEEDIEAIVGQHGLVVITREGSNPNKFIYDSDSLSKHMHNINIVTEWIPNEVSSSRIRRALKRGESVRYLLPDSVIDYIYKHGIYDAKPATTTMIKLELSSPNANNYLTIDTKYQSTFLSPSPSDVTMGTPSPIEVISIDVPDSVLRKNVQNTSHVVGDGLEEARERFISSLVNENGNGKHLAIAKAAYPGQAKQIIATETGEAQILDEVGLPDDTGKRESAQEAPSSSHSLEDPSRTKETKIEPGRSDGRASPIEGTKVDAGRLDDNSLDDKSFELTKVDTIKVDRNVQNKIPSDDSASCAIETNVECGRVDDRSSGTKIDDDRVIEIMLEVGKEGETCETVESKESTSLSSTVDESSSRHECALSDFGVDKEDYAFETAKRIELNEDEDTLDSVIQPEESEAHRKFFSNSKNVQRPIGDSKISHETSQNMGIVIEELKLITDKTKVNKELSKEIKSSDIDHSKRSRSQSGSKVETVIDVSISASNDAGDRIIDHVENLSTASTSETHKDESKKDGIKLSPGDESLDPSSISDENTTVKDQSLQEMDQRSTKDELEDTEEIIHEEKSIKRDSSFEIDGKYLKSIVNSRKSPRKSKNGQMRVFSSDDIVQRQEDQYKIELDRFDEPKTEPAAKFEKPKDSKKSKMSSSLRGKPEKTQLKSSSSKKSSSESKYESLRSVEFSKDFPPVKKGDVANVQRLDAPLKGSLDSVINANEPTITSRRKGKSAEEAFAKKSKSYESFKKIQEVYSKEAEKSSRTDSTSQLITADILDAPTDEYCSVCYYVSEMTRRSEEGINSPNQETFYTLQSTCSSFADEDSTECDICSSWNLQESSEALDRNIIINEDDQICEICEICGVDVVIDPDQEITRSSYVDDRTIDSRHFQRENVRIVDGTLTDPSLDEDSFEIENCGFQSGTESTDDRGRISAEAEPITDVDTSSRPFYFNNSSNEKTRDKYFIPKDEVAILSSGTRRINRKGSLLRKKIEDSTGVTQDKRRYSSADNLQQAKVFSKGNDKFVKSKGTKLIGSADNIRTSRGSRRCKSLQRSADNVRYIDSSTDNLDSLAESLGKEEEVEGAIDWNGKPRVRDNETVKMILTKHGIKIISEKETAL